MSAVCGVRCKFQVQYYVPNARVPRWYQCQKNSNYRPPTKLWEGNVFICVCPSVNLSVHRRSPCDHYLWCIGPYCTGLHPQPWPLWTSDLGPQASVPLLVTSGGHHWRPVLTCSFEDPHEQHLVVTIEAHTVSTGRQNASCWNVFFFKLEIYKWSTFMTCFSLFITRYGTFKT